MFTYSKDGLHLTEQFEGCKLKAYQDSGGVWTIGYGHTHCVLQNDTCTLEQAEQWVIDDINYSSSIVNRNVKIEINQHEFDALVDFVFNVGVGNFLSSTLLKYLNAGNFKAAAAEFLRWDKCKGVKLAGLLARRQAEKTEFELP